MDYLLFRLYGPMASWGDISVGEYRPTFVHPTKSAIVGILAAALGIRRDEEDRQKELAESCEMAVRMDAEGVLLRDYHTIQVAPSGSARNKNIFDTRSEELSGPKENLKTILSTRDYRCDALFTICIWYSEATRSYSLRELCDKLKCPVYTLYLGRKSCPVSLPLQPRVVQAENIQEAFNQIAFAEGDLDGLPRSSQIHYYWEEGAEARIKGVHKIVRRDHPLSRKRRQFTNRTEIYGVLEEE